MTSDLKCLLPLFTHHGILYFGTVNQMKNQNQNTNPEVIFVWYITTAHNTITNTAEHREMASPTIWRKADNISNSYTGPFPIKAQCQLSLNSPNSRLMNSHRAIRLGYFLWLSSLLASAVPCSSGPRIQFSVSINSVNLTSTTEASFILRFQDVPRNQPIV